MRPINMKYVQNVFQPGAAQFVSEATAKREALKQEMASVDPSGEKRRKYLEEVANGEHRQEVAGAIVENVNVDVLAHLFALGFFEVVTLGAADFPVIRTTKRQSNFTIGYLAEDNGAPRRQRVDSLSHRSLNMTQVSTEKYEYPWRNLTTGFHDYAGEAQNELAYELDLKMDQLALDLMKSSKKASGLRATLNLHKSIIATNIPDANYLDLTSSGTYGTTGKWTVKKLQAIFSYINRFSADVEPDGSPLKIKSIYMSSARLEDFWDFVDLVTGFDSSLTGPKDPVATVPTSVREQIWNSGGIVSAFGNQFNLVPRNTLAADEVYISTNKPMGRLYVKPSMDVVERDQSFELHERNLEAMAVRKVVQFDQPSHLTKNYLVVKL